MKMLKKKLKDLKKNSQYLENMSDVFCIMSVLGMLFTVLFLFLTHGTYFEELFFYDDWDLGMDFFHSIEYTRGRAPYELFGTLYPPLANLFFYILYCLVPTSQSEKWADTFGGGVAARGTDIDLRVHQPTMMLFVLFIMIVSVCLILLVKKISTEDPMALEVGICMLFSHGVLMAFNRGNIIIMASLCSMFFVFFKDSENKMVSELALVLLGVAFGLKIYPAVFGILLLYDKQYKKALRATIYGIIMLILPMFVFKEKINGVAMFFHGLFSFAEGSEGTFSARGYTVDGIVNMVSVVLGRAFGFIVNDGLLFSKINYIFAASVLLLGIFLRNKWEKILVCTIAMIICKSQGTYILCFLLIPLLAMIKEEKVVSYQNMLPFTALAMLCILLPLRNERYIIISAMDIKNQMCIMMLLIYVTVMGIYGFRDWFREKLETE